MIGYRLLTISVQRIKYKGLLTNETGMIFSLERNSATIQRAVRSKTILASGQPVKLYSLDGKTWFSKAKIYAEFKRRRAGEKETFQKWFRRAALERYL